MPARRDARAFAGCCGYFVAPPEAAFGVLALDACEEALAVLFWAPGLPPVGGVDAAATDYASTADLANAIRRTSIGHGEHEQREGGECDVNWPDWYSAYMVAEQAGTELPT